MRAAESDIRRGFEAEVLAYIRHHGMIRPGVVLVALSGGGDSVALLGVLASLRDDLGITIEAAHLNHALRGAESDADEDFARTLCRESGIHLTVERCAEGGIIDADGSMETVARTLRIDFLERTAHARGAAMIATGHTLDDQAETLLQRIIRGTGPSGLAGILPVRDGRWIRPLLGVSRSRIRAYLGAVGVPFREDATNDDTGISRNRVRHELIPLLESRFSPAVRETLARLAELARDQEEYLDSVTAKALARCLLYTDADKILLDKGKFVQYHNVVKQRIVRECLWMLDGRGRDTDRDEVDGVLGVVERDGVCDVSSRIACAAEPNVVLFVVKMGAYDPVPVAMDGETDIPGGGRIHARSITTGRRGDGVAAVVLGGGIVARYGPLSVGCPRSGEVMIPAGGTGRVKVRDILARAHVPGLLRATMPVVRAGAVPLWMPGVASSDILYRDDAGTFAGKRAVLLRFRDGMIWRDGTCRRAPAGRA